MDNNFNRGYCYYKGVANHEELRKFNQETGDLPECEAFKYYKEGDELRATNGYIAIEDFADEVWEQIPDTLAEALNIN